MNIKKIIVVLMLGVLAFGNSVRMLDTEVAEVVKNNALTGTSIQAADGFLNIDMDNQQIDATSNIKISFRNVPSTYILDSFMIGTSYYASEITTPAYQAGTTITTAQITYKYGANDNIVRDTVEYTFGNKLTNFPTQYFDMVIQNNHVSENIIITGNIRLEKGEDVPSQITSVTNTAVTADTTATELLASNPDRRYASFINDGDTVVYLAIGASANVNEGIRLNANGGSFEISGDNLLLGQVTGITVTASRVVIIEGE